jgi:hypothetical protein
MLRHCESGLRWSEKIAGVNALGPTVLYSPSELNESLIGKVFLTLLPALGFRATGTEIALNLVSGKQGRQG